MPSPCRSSSRYATTTRSPSRCVAQRANGARGPTWTCGSGNALALDLRPADLRPALQDAPKREQQRDEGERCSTHDAIDVEGGVPRDDVSLDDVRPGRLGRETEPASRSATDARLGSLTTAATRAAGERGRGDDRHAVALIGLSEHALDRQHVPGSLEDLLNLHAILLSSSHPQFGSPRPITEPGGP